MSHAPLALSLPLAVVLLLLAVPAGITAARGYRGTLTRKGRLGLHTPAAQASDRAFAIANRVASPLVAGAAAAGAACAVLVVALPAGIGGAIVIAVVGLAGLLGQFYAATLVGERVAHAIPRPARKPQGGCCGSCGCADSNKTAGGTEVRGGNGAASTVPNGAANNDGNAAPALLRGLSADAASSVARF